MQMELKQITNWLDFDPGLVTGMTNAVTSLLLQFHEISSYDAYEIDQIG